LSTEGIVVNAFHAMSWSQPLCTWDPHLQAISGQWGRSLKYQRQNQGDRIGWIFARWSVVYYRQLIEIYRKSPKNIWANFFTDKRRVLFWQRIYWATLWATSLKTKMVTLDTTKTYLRNVCVITFEIMFIVRSGSREIISVYHKSVAHTNVTFVNTTRTLLKLLGFPAPITFRGKRLV
jgi:hypothetical protein